ncbi:MAG TPA: DUF4149 domain-containing protein [Geobacteraceae bacterium]
MTSPVLLFVYRLAIALWVGGVSLFTFVLTPILFKTQTRDVAGQIVGTLFPAYFRWGLACGSVAVLSLLFIKGKNFVPSLVLLVLMLLITSFQAFIVEPKAALLKKEIISFETTPKDHPLRREFSKLHGVSAVCNLGVFGGGVVLLALL